MSLGNVAQLWRYPVKSMQGERCTELSFGPNGFDGDRRYAVVDRATGRTLTAKTVPELLFAVARTVSGDVVVDLPAGETYAAEDQALSDAVAGWLGRDCAVVRADRAEATSYDMTFDPEHDDAEQFEIPVGAGTFFDLTPLHVLTTTSLAAMAAANGSSSWDVRRFRPNVLVSGAGPEGADVEPPTEALAPGTPHPSLPENAWVGTTVEIGADGASFEAIMAALRCAMPNRAQPGLDRDLEIFRTMQAVHGNHLGVYATPVGSGMVREGDELRTRS